MNALKYETILICRRVFLLFLKFPRNFRTSGRTHVERGSGVLKNREIVGRPLGTFPKVINAVGKTFRKWARRLPTRSGSRLQDGPKMVDNEV